MSTVNQSRNHSPIGMMTALRKSIAWLALIFCVFMAVPVQTADAETRKLKLYFLHTGEREEITYKRNGRYLPGGLKKINRFLRDWRRNEPTKMDPKLLDLIWEVYQETGSRKPIHVISAYRSLKTNNLLRKRGRGVAKKSQHSLGKAMDFYIPGVKLSKLRAIGLKKGIGGVGYYPKSGSPFVHMDTGRVRHWPRMSRKQLVRVFPNGKTLHVPTDGKPLPGYNIAKSRYEKATRGKIVVARADEIEKKPNFFAKLLGADDEDDNSDAATAPKPVATSRTATPKTSAPLVPAASQVALVAPATIPVPILAPRNIPAIGTDAIQIADARLEPIDGALVGQEVASALPVPVQASRSIGAIEPVAIIAQAEPLVAAEPTPQLQVAALSPTEIQDLRQQVGQAIRTPVSRNTPRFNNTSNTNVAARQPGQKRLFPPRVTTGSRAVRAPRPGSGLVGENQRLANSGNALFGYANDGSNDAAVTTARIQPSTAAQSALENQFATSRIEQASLAPAPEVERPANSEPMFTATPSLKPQRVIKENELKTAESEIAALEVVEPEIDAPEVETPDTSVQIAGIPVPVRNPLRGLRVEQPIQTAALAPIQPRKAEPNELSLEQFESANLGERLVGKWALASNASISDIAEMHAPAYGLNALRERPNTVLSSGFSPRKIEGFTKGFSGSSVEFLNFKRFD